MTAYALYRTDFKAMGSPCQFLIYSQSQAQAQAAMLAAYNEIDRLEKKYSRYRADSLASLINSRAGTGRPVCVDFETQALLAYADEAFKQSGGLFDITSGVLRKAWDFKKGIVPDQASIESLLPLVGWDKVIRAQDRLLLPVEGMELDFGGYVKEYAVDVAVTQFKAQGVRHGLVNLGGDLAVTGPHPDGSAWEVGVRDPQHPDRAVMTLPMVEGALATSGIYERCIKTSNGIYSHILNPKTGWPVQGLLAVTLAADQCVVAGVATTIALLKGEVAGNEWLQSLQKPFVSIDSQNRLLSEYIS